MFIIISLKWINMLQRDKLSTLGQGRLIATTILRAAKDLFADMNGNYL